MPNNAKVFIVEDAFELICMGRDELEAAGHQVVAQAENLQDALALVPKLGELGVQVAVLDANLNSEGTNGADGGKIAQAIRAAHPKITIVQWSISHVDYGWSDVQVDKSSIGRTWSLLAPTVTSA